MEKEFGALGVSVASWRTLVEAIWPEAKTVEAVGMALSYCKARKLDPFKRPVHIVPVYNSTLGRMVETVWPGISELRTTAMRTGVYAGKDQVEYGPLIKKKIGTVEIEFHEWARVTVYRIVGNHRVAFEGDPVYWEESYAQRGGKDKDPSPNAMWKKRPKGQHAKVAEASSLRQAFPEELGGTYSAEEMEGQTIGENPVDTAYRGHETKQRRTLDVETGEVVDQTQPDAKDGVDEEPAEEASQEAEFEEGGDPTDGDGHNPGPAVDPEQHARDLELITETEGQMKNAAPVDRHFDLAEVVEDLRQIAADEAGASIGIRERAAALVKMHDDDKADHDKRMDAKKSRAKQ